MEPNPHALAAAITKYHNILIAIKGSPDPDAIASSYAIHEICRKLKVSSTIAASKKLSLPANKLFVSALEIPLHIAPDFPEPSQFDAYIVTDHPSPALFSPTPPLPCAAFIDHHEPADEEIRADYMLRNKEAGSTSTLIALIIKNIGIELEPESMTHVATALLYGIYTDTDKYSHAGKLDYEALDYLSKYSDHEIFNKISSISLSKETLGLLKHAIESKITYKDWLISGVGFLDDANRDSIAIIADFLLKREKCPTVIVYAAIEDVSRGTLTLDASLRSASGNMNLDDIIKQITPQGGARKFKGAFQIDMNYFTHCPDRKLLWEVIRLTTVELLKKCRDELIITEIKGAYQKIRKRIRDYFS